MAHKNAAYMGMEKEPPSKNGPRGGGKPPMVHSHSMRPHRKVMPRGHRKGYRK